MSTSPSKRRRPSHPDARRNLSPPVDRNAEEADHIVLGPRALPGVAILPLRLFLGLTFIYAGIQKLDDPNFLTPGHPTYIGNQLLAFSRGSPIQSILLHLMEHAVAIGLLTVVTELAIGTLILVGLLTRPVAAIGLVLNFIFFLSASWHTYPYFYGADIVFVMCWLTIVLTGPGPLALDPYAQPVLWKALDRLMGLRLGWLGQAILMGHVRHAAVSEDSRTRARAHDTALLNRSEALIGATAAVMLVILGVVPRGSTSSSLGGKLASGPKSPAPSASGVEQPSPTPAPNVATNLPPGARKIGNVSQLPANTAGMVSDPKTGDPVVVIHTKGSDFYAYDAVCTHAGCTVQYDPQQQLLVCPCHGGEFDPAHGAQVVAGPPPAPLGQIIMKIDSRGDIYIV